MDRDVAWIRTGAKPGADSRDTRPALDALLTALNVPPPNEEALTALIMRRLARDGLVPPDAWPPTWLRR